MAANPDQDIVTKLAASVGSLTENTNLFIGKMPAKGPNVPAQCVTVLASGGPAPEAMLSTKEEMRTSRAQVMVRSSRHDFPGGQSLARECRDALHHQDLSGYIDVTVLDEEPIYLEEDDHGQHLWAVNVELLHDTERI